MHASNGVRTRVQQYGARSLTCPGVPAGESLSIGPHSCCKATISKQLNSGSSCNIVNAGMSATSDLEPQAFEAFLLWLSSDRDQALKLHDNIMRKITRYFVRTG